MSHLQVFPFQQATMLPLALFPILLVSVFEPASALFWTKLNPVFTHPTHSSLSPVTGSLTASPSGYVGQHPIHSTSDYSYNWNNYQHSYPGSSVLFPTVDSAALHQSQSAPTTSLLGSIFRPWWTWKFNKFSLRPSSSTSPCSSFWQSGSSGAHPCITPSLCCLPPSSSSQVIHTSVNSRPYHTDPASSGSAASSVTYPSSSYIYHSPNHRTSLQPQSSDKSEQVELISS